MVVWILSCYQLRREDDYSRFRRGRDCHRLVLRNLDERDREDRKEEAIRNSFEDSEFNVHQ